MKANAIQERVQKLFGERAVAFDNKQNGRLFLFSDTFDIPHIFWIEIRRGKQYVRFALPVDVFAADESEWLPSFRERIDLMFSRILP